MGKTHGIKFKIIPPKKANKIISKPKYEFELILLARLLFFKFFEFLITFS